MYWVNKIVRTYTEFYRTNTESQDVVKHQSGINKYMQKTAEPENDAGFLKVIIIAAVHVSS